MSNWIIRCANRRCRHVCNERDWVLKPKKNPTEADIKLQKIVKRAESSEIGLGRGLTHKNGHLALSTYAEPHDLTTLAHTLVNAYHEKYDLISVFDAALRHVAEAAASGRKP